jgi:KDO2-lipid IV(A) lauroyltransferase
MSREPREAMSRIFRRLKNDLIYVAVRAAARAVGLLPVTIAAAVGRCVGLAAYCLAGRERRRAMANLEAALGNEIDARGRRRVVRRLAVNLGEWACFDLALCRRGDALEWVEFPDEDRERLLGALAGGEGAVAFSAHFGNWELLAAALARSGVRVSTLARAGYDPRLGRLVEDLRGRFGVKTIWRESPGAAGGMISALRNGELLALLIDQDIRGAKGAFVPFFGRPAFTAVGAAALALRLDAPALGIFLHPTGRLRHRIRVETVPLARSNDRARDVRENTALFTAAIERQIRERPECWVWFHDRYRTRPGPPPAPRLHAAPRAEVGPRAAAGRG